MIRVSFVWRSSEQITMAYMSQIPCERDIIALSGRMSDKPQRLLRVINVMWYLRDEGCDTEGRAHPREVSHVRVVVVEHD